MHKPEMATGIHVSPHPEPPSHLLPHPIRLGCPRAPALGALPHASHLHWSSVLHVVMYMFQCCSLKSFIRVPISFLRAPVSWPNHLMKSSPPNPITLGTRFLCKDLRESFPGGPVVKNPPSSVRGLHRAQYLVLEDSTCLGATKPMCHYY